MKQILFAAAVLAAAAVPAAAQGPLAYGQTARGELGADDPQADDGSYYDVWTFTGRAGQRVSITMRSDDFDAYLAVGRDAVECGDDCHTDDDGAGGTDAAVIFTLPASGRYEIRANSLLEGETGAYTLTLQDRGVPGPARPRGAVRPGETVDGALDENDPMADDESYHELWTVRGSAGDVLEITLHSDDFDAYLGWGRMVDGEFQELVSDDDGAGGTDSRLVVEMDDSGEYVIRATSLNADETGRYSLTVEHGEN